MAATHLEMGEPPKPSPTQTQLLFAQVQFYIVPSPGLQGEPAETVRRVLMTWLSSLLISARIAREALGRKWSCSVLPVADRR